MGKVSRRGLRVWYMWDVRKPRVNLHWHPLWCCHCVPCRQNDLFLQASMNTSLTFGGDFFMSDQSCLNWYKAELTVTLPFCMETFELNGVCDVLFGYAGVNHCLFLLQENWMLCITLVLWQMQTVQAITWPLLQPMNTTPVPVSENIMSCGHTLGWVQTCLCARVRFQNR